MEKAKMNDIVRVHYTGKLSTGEVFDSSEGADPLEFAIGSGMLIPGFENAIVGMGVDESKIIVIAPDEAYGPVSQEMVQKISVEQLPQGMKPEAGMELVSETPDGQQFVVVVKEVTDEFIVIDANHPLAGKELTFEIRLVEIVGAIQ